MDQDNNSANETPFDIGSAIKSMTGIVLLVIGVFLGFYVVNIGIGLINAETPPALVTQITESGLEQAENVADHVAEAANAKDGPLRVEISKDIKQLVSYFIVFLLLAVSVSFAATLIRCGVRLMRSDANEALKKIANRLN